jgi:taurine dioxygenase
VSQKELLYDHVYGEGDLVIVDNLAVGHEASPETQLPRKKVVLMTVQYTGNHRYLYIYT